MTEPGNDREKNRSTKRRGRWWRRFLSLLLIVSLLANVVLFNLVQQAARKPYREVFISGEPDAEAKVVIVPVSGLLTASSAASLRSTIRALEKDDSVHGVLLKVDSPGGTVAASDRMYHELLEYKRAKQDASTTAFPVVTFIQGLGASGAYYLACATDEVIAEPTALVGSIGVRMTFFNVSGLLSEWQVQVETLKSGPWKDAGSPFRALTDQERERFMQLIRHYYETFLDVVREGRGDRIDEDQLLKIANGDVYVADEALEYRLIDRIGYLDDAIERVRELTGLDRLRVVELRRRWQVTDLFQLQLSVPDPIGLWPLSERSTLYSPRFYYAYGQFLPGPVQPK